MKKCTDCKRNHNDTDEKTLTSLNSFPSSTYSGSSLTSATSYLGGNDSNDSNSLDNEVIYTCSICKISFKNKQTLILHQKTASKCADKEYSDKNNTKMCEFCDKTLASKQMKKYHESTCINKILKELNLKHEIEIQKLKEHFENEIKTLKNTYEKI